MFLILCAPTSPTTKWPHRPMAAQAGACWGVGEGGMPSPGSRNFTLHKGLSLEKVCEWVINFPGKCWASLTFEIDPMRL